MVWSVRVCPASDGWESRRTGLSHKGTQFSVTGDVSTAGLSGFYCPVVFIVTDTAEGSAARSGRFGGADGAENGPATERSENESLDFVRKYIIFAAEILLKSCLSGRAVVRCVACTVGTVFPVWLKGRTVSYFISQHLKNRYS